MTHRFPIPAEREHSSGDGAGHWASRAIAGVLRHAQEGELPLFAWTLGLPQPALLTMIEHCFPEIGMLEPMPEPEYAAIARTVPQAFQSLRELLFDHRAPGGDEQLADWLARAIAAASFGSRHLWEDLGLPGRDIVSALLSRHFPSFHARNSRDWKWKRFLFSELGVRNGNPDMKPPECGKYGQFQLCFPV